MNNLEKAIKELLAGKKFKYKNCVLSYSKDGYIPFLSEKLDPTMFEQEFVLYQIKNLMTMINGKSMKGINL